MRTMPQFESTDGYQFAGSGLDSGGGGGGGYTPPSYSTDEVDTGLKWIDGKNIYMKTYHITKTSNGTIYDMPLPANCNYIYYEYASCGSSYGLVNNACNNYGVPILRITPYNAGMGGTFWEYDGGLTQFTQNGTYATLYYTKK